MSWGIKALCFCPTRLDDSSTKVADAQNNLHELKQKNVFLEKQLGKGEDGERQRFVRLSFSFSSLSSSSIFFFLHKNPFTQHIYLYKNNFKYIIVIQDKLCSIIMNSHKILLLGVIANLQIISW